MSLRQAQPNRVTAFTLVELLVVMAIVVILMAVLVPSGRKVLTSGRVTETRSLLHKLDLVAEQFEMDAPLAKVPGYTARYGGYPPDELYGFVEGGLPNSGACILPSGAELVYNGEVITSHAGLEPIPERDVRAFVLAVRMYSPAGTKILDDLQGKYRADSEGVVVRTEVSEDVPAENTYADVLVDPWGTPLDYFSTRFDSGFICESCPCGVLYPDESRCRASDLLVGLNDDFPVFVSYGPDGPEQLGDDFARITQDLVADVKDATDDGIRNRFNQDNVYSTPELKTKVQTVELSP